MTADRHSIAASSTYQPAWMPDTYPDGVPVGEHWDVVRIAGLRGQDVANALGALTKGDPGPIVHELYEREWVHVLVAAGSTAAFRWPPGIQALARDTRRERWIDVPPLAGSRILSWHSRPTETAPLVDTRLCHTVLIWQLQDVLAPGNYTAEPDPFA